MLCCSSWIETHKLERYKKGAGNSGAKRSAALREACAAIEAYIENGEGVSTMVAFLLIIFQLLLY